MIEKIYFKQAKSASFVPIKIKATQKLIKSGFGEDTFLVPLLLLLLPLGLSPMYIHISKQEVDFLPLLFAEMATFVCLYSFSSIFDTAHMFAFYSSILLLFL